jgi:hypothetical protein
LNFEEEGNFVVGLGSFFGHYIEWGLYFARLSMKARISNVMVGARPVWGASISYLVKDFTLWYLYEGVNFVAGLKPCFGSSNVIIRTRPV